jgi:hypothetical protein
MQTFEQVNDHVEKNTKAINALSIAPADKGIKLAKVWVIAKPILMMVGAFPLLPKKWRDVINILMVTIDEVSNTQQ